MSIDIDSLNDEAVTAIIKDQIEKRNFNALKGYLNHKSPKVRSYTIESLSKFAYEIDLKDVYKKGIKDQDQSVRIHTLRSLTEVYKYAADKRRKNTMSSDGKITETKDPEGVYSHFNTNYFPIILTALDDQQKNVITKALKLLEQIGNPVTVGYLVKLLKTEDEELKQRISNLLKNRLYEYDWGRNSKEALPPLLEALKDNDPYVRLNAVNNLKVTGEHGHKYLLQSLKDKDPTVRIAACYALANTRDSLFLADLFEMTKDGEREVRDSAKDALISLLGVARY